MDNENVLDEDILQVLGSNTLKNADEMGQKIHDQIADRWENIIQNGIEKNEKEEILKQNYVLPPINCPHLIVPMLNPETLAACSEINKKRDASIEARQRMLSHAIASLASATEMTLTQVQPKTLKIKLIEVLNNTGKLLSDIFHNENKTRRNLIISGLEKDVRDTLLQTKPQKLLFGDNLLDKIKTAKSVGKTGREIRLQPKQTPKTTFKGTTQPLNWRGPPRKNQKETRGKDRSSGPKQKKPTTTQHRYKRYQQEHRNHRRN